MLRLDGAIVDLNDTDHLVLRFAGHIFFYKLQNDEGAIYRACAHTQRLEKAATVLAHERTEHGRAASLKARAAGGHK